MSPEAAKNKSEPTKGAGRTGVSLAVVSGRCDHRDPEDDFFCLRYQVWYPSFDCAFRTHFRTAPGCFDCDQGRFNRRRHAATLGRLLANRRFRLRV